MTDPTIRLVFLAHLGATLYMVGLIWFVQVVHYPLFARVGSNEFASYEQRHTALTTWVVAPPMLIEGITAVLLFWFSPIELPIWSLLIGLLLLAVAWLSTACIQVPCHNVLSRGFDPVVHRRLVVTNWLRTAVWSLRGGLVLGLVWASLSSDTTATNMGRMEMGKIDVGDRVPDFSAMTQDGTEIRLADYLGKRALVLFFYPKDGTPLCTQEACAFRDSYEEFSDAGAEVIGVSGDSEESHRSFATQHKLSFPLISDTDGSLRKTFGVPRTMGLFPGRVTYVIDKSGIVRKIFSSQFTSNEHVRQALTALSTSNQSSE